MKQSASLENMQQKPPGYFEQVRPEMLQYIPHNAKRIIDVGCGNGTFGSQLRQRQNAEVWGLELDSEAANAAALVLNNVIAGTVEEKMSELPVNYFDCIVFNDVLEHLVDPYSALIEAKRHLAPNGVVVCSIPNIRYLPTLIDLTVRKDWNYTDSGILDKTHLRFFTKKSLLHTFQRLGYDAVLHGINPLRSWKFWAIHIATLGFFADSRFLQFACIATPKKGVSS